ncbi:hypothetical protein [Puniceicoccus vermicola]|uniref:Uncharacterized protein n=1 Tax=Puniceicoccus vermicola TaxID=388746 RepID=A0A7X1AWJ3_9BACT|nr:hypothetical protein [Puniceicoccus vermicola]MBC2601157.1 hypothetical protein [Puniceicoccus vermicola]
MRYLALPVAFLFFSIASLSAESPIFDELSVAETHFKITMDDYPLEVTKQGITLRAVHDTVTRVISPESKQINDFAYRTYHLEFAFKQKYRIKGSLAVIEFFEGNDLIHSISLDSPSRKLAKPNERLNETNFLAISLEGVPLVMLDSIDRINLRESD